jgi:pre-mRNA-processing factor 6
METQRVVIERDAWFKEAESAEKSQFVVTARALVAATLSVGVEEQDRRNTWVNDAETVRRRSDDGDGLMV